MTKIRGLTYILSLLILLFFLIFAPLVQGKSTESLSSLDEQSFLFEQIPSVFGASKYEQKVTEAPSAVSIVTSDEIKKYGYQTLSDILKSIRGFYITYDRNYEYLGVRGFSIPGDYNTRILHLLDGQVLNDSVFSCAYIGTEFILDVDLIDRVEIIRGPSSSLYGTNAFFGVINIITKRGRDLKGLELSTEAGSFNTYKGRLTYGKRFQNGLEMLFSSSYYDSHGDDNLYYREFDDPGTNNGIAENCDKDQYHSFFTKITFYDFTLEGAFSEREKEIPTASFETVFNDSDTRTVDKLYFINLKYDYGFSNQLDIKSQIYYAKYYYEGVYAFDYSEDDEPYFVNNMDFADARWFGGDVQFTKFFNNNKLIGGAEYRNNIKVDQMNCDEEVYLDDKRNSYNYGIYMQDEFYICSPLSLNIGLRYDYYKIFGDTTNPRAALIYKQSDNTTLKLLYGQAFRAPSAYELYYHDGGYSQKPSLNLQPETIKTYEVVLDHYFSSFICGSLTGFYNRISNLISLETDLTDDLMIFGNSEKLETKGCEVELEGRFKSGMKGHLSYAFQETKNKENNLKISNSPKHLIKLNVIVPIINGKIFCNIEEQYTSKRQTLSGNQADEFFITNINFFTTGLAQGFEASFGIYNLFDKKYGDPGSEEHIQDIILQDGQSFRLKIVYSF